MKDKTLDILAEVVKLTLCILVGAAVPCAIIAIGALLHVGWNLVEDK